MQYHPDIAGADNDPQKTGWAHRAIVRRQLLIISGEVDVLRPERGMTIRGGDCLIRMAVRETPLQDSYLHRWQQDSPSGCIEGRLPALRLLTKALRQDSFPQTNATAQSPL